MKKKALIRRKKEYAILTIALSFFKVLNNLFCGSIHFRCKHWLLWFKVTATCIRQLGNGETRKAVLEMHCGDNAVLDVVWRSWAVILNECQVKYLKIYKEKCWMMKNRPYLYLWLSKSEYMFTIEEAGEGDES